MQRARDRLRIGKCFLDRPPQRGSESEALDVRLLHPPFQRQVKIIGRAEPSGIEHLGHAREALLGGRLLEGPDAICRFRYNLGLTHVQLCSHLLTGRW